MSLSVGICTLGSELVNDMVSMPEAAPLALGIGCQPPTLKKAVTSATSRIKACVANLCCCGFGNAIALYGSSVSELTLYLLRL